MLRRMFVVHMPIPAVPLGTAYCLYVGGRFSNCSDARLALRSHILRKLSLRRSVFVLASPTLTTVYLYYISCNALLFFVSTQATREANAELCAFSHFYACVCKSANYVYQVMPVPNGLDVYTLGRVLIRMTTRYAFSSLDSSSFSRSSHLAILVS